MSPTSMRGTAAGRARRREASGGHRFSRSAFFRTHAVAHRFGIRSGDPASRAATGIWTLASQTNNDNWRRPMNRSARARAFARALRITSMAAFMWGASSFAAQAFEVEEATIQDLHRA